jgi:hypothetical protein
VLLLCCCCVAAVLLLIPDAWRMNALTGSPLTSDGGKADGSGGLLKQQGYILVVPQGSGGVGEGQVRTHRAFDVPQHDTALQAVHMYH